MDRNDVFNRLINEDIEFKNQDEKINALNKVIETTKKMLGKCNTGKTSGRHGRS